MSLFARENVLVGSGDQGVYPADQPLYGTPTTWGAKAPLLVGIGQYVFYDVDKMVSLGAPLTTTTNAKIGIGVGVNGPKGPELRTIVAERVSGCYATHISAEPARCGTNPQKDLWIDCTECHKDYAIVVKVENNESEGFSAWNRGYEYVFTYRTQCGGCGADCPEPHDQNELLCGLHNVINGKFQPGWDIAVNGKPISNQELPFSAHKLFFGSTVDVNGNPTDATHKEWCFTPTFDTTLQEWVIEDIASIFFGGAQNDFVNTTATGDGAALVTPVSRLDSLKDQANAFLGGQGEMSIIQGTGNPSCGITVIVDSCNTDVELRDDTDTLIATCVSGNPFDGGISVPDNCDDCTSVDTTLRPTIGLRFIMKETTTDCECFAGNTTKAWLGTKLDVYPITGFEDGGWHVIPVASGTLPEGLGYVWEDKERLSARQGGSGYKHTIHQKEGRYDIPGSKNKITNVTTKCDEQYCVIALENTNEYAAKTGFNNPSLSKFRSYFLIPSGDTTTQTEFVTLFNSYFAGGACGLTSVDCGTDQDQDQPQ